jgi:hypothetical protein
LLARCIAAQAFAEINNWINKNIPHKVRDSGAFRYAILDDDSDMLLWQQDHFFQTSFEDGGLAEEIAAAVIALK